MTGSVTYDDECSPNEGEITTESASCLPFFLQNAVKYSDEGTEITMHVAKRRRTDCDNGARFWDCYPGE